MTFFINSALVIWHSKTDFYAKTPSVRHKEAISDLWLSDKFDLPLNWYFLSSADILQNQLFWKILSGIPSECQTVWIEIKPDVVMGLILAQPVCKVYQQTTQYATGRQRGMINWKHLRRWKKSEWSVFEFTKESEYDQEIPQPTRGIVRKSHRAPTATMHQEDN